MVVFGCIPLLFQFLLHFLSTAPTCCIFFSQTNPYHASFNLFPPFHPSSTLFTFSIHFMCHCLHQNILLSSSQNMTIPPHTIRPCQLICCCFQSQHVHQLHCIPLAINFTLLQIFLIKITTSFSLKHHASLPYNIADLT